MSSHPTFGNHKTCISCKRVEPTPGQSQCLICRRNTNRKSRKKKKLEVEKKIEEESARYLLQKLQDKEKFSDELLKKINKLITDFLED